MKNFGSMKNLSVLFLIWNTVSIVSTADWGYNDVSEWTGLCQSGTQQSPIDLADAEPSEKVFSAFKFSNYNIYSNASITNNGHSVAIFLNTPVSPSVSEGGLIGDYVLNHLHFHWKSEHTIDGYRYPLEMHLVHHSSQYSSLSEAVQHSGGVAVLGVLFKLSLDDDEEFVPVIKVIGEVIRDRNTNVPLQKPISAKNFLPRDTADYYRYMGSLTTPGCNEGVIWTVFTETLPISADQMNHFEAVALTDGPRTINYRPVQPLNGRTISIRSSPAPSSPVKRSASSKPNISLQIVFSFAILTYIKSTFLKDI